MIGFTSLLLFCVQACPSAAEPPSLFVASGLGYLRPSSLSYYYQRPQSPHQVAVCSSLVDGFSVDTMSNNFLRDNNGISDYFIQQVSTKTKALDVKVFRGFNIPAREYVLEQQMLGNYISEEDAIDLLMKNYHDDGSYIYNKPQCEPEIYFVAMYNGTEVQSFARQNGIIGVVSVQLRNIPSPHVYVANLRVDIKMQRRGVAMALLSSGGEYANSCSEKINEQIPLVLSVDDDNTGAICLYKKMGFEYMEREDGFCRMIRWP